jgi:hypothetical protein
MKRITKISLFTVGLVLAGLAGVVPGFRPLAKLQAVVQADNDHVLTFDVACDCRTGATLDGSVRGAPFIIQGKMFPAGALPSGTASNDPTQPVNGVASIGNWICRGQVVGTLPPAIASAYASTPFAYNAQYYILHDGRALTAEGYDLPTGDVGLTVTGGIGRFSGAAGDIQINPLGTNGTGCPNFRAKFNLQPGSERGERNDHD